MKPNRVRLPLLVLLLGIAACAVNPVTGQREIVLMSEAQEIAMGKEAAPQIAASMGLYEDPELQRYVEAIGLRMAKASERPHLPWQFRVVDDPLVNAFAVPGGFIYVTRGILAHFSSEAQMASVLGHEIGHVTARHSVAQYTKQIGAQLALTGGLIALATQSPSLADASQQLAGAGIQVLLLKYGRDDETQSDELGLRYMTEAGYDANEMPVVFRTLDGIGARAGAGAIPEWLSSHPKPANREAMMKARIAALPPGPKGRVGRREYLARIDGIVFGEDPRQGFFRGDTFHHPELAFRVSFPSGWKQVNQRTMVGALDPNQQAMVQLTVAEGETPQSAANAFLSGEGLSATPPKSESIGGLSAVTADFAAQTQQGYLRGVVVFVSHRKTVFQIIGLTSESRFAGYENALRAAVRSFAPERNASILGVMSPRIGIVTPARDYTIEAFARAYPGPVSAQDLALMNQVPPGGRYARGVPVKRVVGTKLP